MIAWKYIDKTAATVAAIRDYNNMSAIIGYTPDTIKALREHMTAPVASHIHEGSPGHNQLAGEDRLAGQIDRLDVLRERYAAAIEYMAWFTPAWETLPERERHILRETYMAGGIRDGARARLAEELSYTERHIDRLRDDALQHFQLLLFG